MFEKILLSLDGSDLAENVIPYGEALAAGLGAELILFHVCEPTAAHNLAHSMHALYLERTAELIKGRHPGVTVSTVRLDGSFTTSICEYVEKNNIGLVLMVPRGFTSLMNMLKGSVTDDVFRLVKCPTLLVRSQKLNQANLKRILLALDGTSGSETALPVARELALRLGAELVLFKMARRSHYAPAQSDMVGDKGTEDGLADRKEQEKSLDYLKRKEEGLRKLGLNVSSMVVLGDEAASAIADATRESGTDLVLMATRGYTDIAAWAQDSVAHRLMGYGDPPLMLVKIVTPK